MRQKSTKYSNGFGVSYAGRLELACLIERNQNSSGLMASPKARTESLGSHPAATNGFPIIRTEAVPTVAPRINGEKKEVVAAVPQVQPRNNIQAVPKPTAPVIAAPKRPLTEPIPPKQTASIRTAPIFYDPVNLPMLEKCYLNRKVISSGKTGHIVGYKLDDWANPQIEIMWAGEFVAEGQKPVTLRVSA
ncbi:MAG: hypothetical protein KGH72_06140 [Candidatus Micrarchaeota archaeon]|nr:hypothetical protein [Candidatus Micrarchaeota archaeon]